MNEARQWVLLLQQIPPLIPKDHWDCAYEPVRLGGMYVVRKRQRLQDVCFSTAEGSSRQVGRHPEQDVFVALHSCSGDLLFTTVNLSEGLVPGLYRTLMAL